MSNNKTSSKAMGYELTGTKGVKDTGAMLVRAAEQVGSFRLLWILLRRHKVGLLAIGNVVLVLNTMVPAWPEIVKSLF
jgi:hypothetical protein